MTDQPFPVDPSSGYPTAAPGEPGAPTQEQWAPMAAVPTIDGVEPVTQDPTYDPQEV